MRGRHSAYFVSYFRAWTKFVFRAKRLGNFSAPDDNPAGGKIVRPPAAWRFGSSRPSHRRNFMDGLYLFAVAGTANKAELVYVWEQATPEAKAIIVCLIIFSIIAWSVMVSKALQMRRARKLNYYFDQEFHAQKNVLELFDRKLQVEGCPLYEVYQAGCVQLDARLRGPGGERSKQQVSDRK